VLEVSPVDRGKGFSFVDETRGGVIPKEFIPAIEKGLRGAMTRGRLAGYPVVDVAVRLLDGSFHAKDSNAMAFEIAASQAFQEATLSAGLTLLEPWMAIEITTPDEALGAVLGDLGSRRGQVRSIDTRGSSQIVSGTAPLATLFGYVSDLRGMSRGRASATLSPSHLAEAPAGVR
jgi:elongation factor G